MTNISTTSDRLIWRGVSSLLAAMILALPAPVAIAGEDEESIQIIEGEERTIYEYRHNGILLIIKIVPKKGIPYYLAPTDGSPHYDDLTNKKNLYPKWVLIEW